MPTIPTGKLERELRKLYLQWVSGLPRHEGDMTAYIDRFRGDSERLVARMGGDVARLGALAGFPAPRELQLSPVAGVVYDQMKQAAISAGIASGLQATDVARGMLRAGMDTGFHRLNRLARTETVSAYWKNAWDSIADLPGLVMVWGSEDGPRTCAWCKERDGLVMDSPDLRDHPNGRCTPIPMLRSRVDYRGSIDSGGSIYYDDTWDRKETEEQRTQRVMDEELAKVRMEIGQGSFNPADYPDFDRAQQAYLKAREDVIMGRATPATPSPSATPRTAPTWSVDTDRKDWTESIKSDPRYDSLTEYVNGSEYINGVARGLLDLDSDTLTHIGNLDTLIKEKGLTAQAPTTLHRVVVDSPDWSAGAHYQQGSSVSEYGFTSTSSSADTLAKMVQEEGLIPKDVWNVELNIPAGQQYVYGADWQDEVLLPPGLKFTVERVDKEGQRIWLTVVP